MIIITFDDADDATRSESHGASLLHLGVIANDGGKLEDCHGTKADAGAIQREARGLLLVPSPVTVTVTAAAAAAMVVMIPLDNTTDITRSHLLLDIRNYHGGGGG